MGKKRVNILLRSFENIKIISQLTAEVLNGETGIPLKISDEVILMAKKIYKDQIDYSHKYSLIELFSIFKSLPLNHEGNNS